ncbi:MAG TPA: glycosyltransferase family 4 protein [Acetobacteraceae bacterium]|nr:glycosyltransferase family 4 protein [Acetobacteraceae bacterium]
MITTDAVGGVWRYSVDLARGFAKAGIDPALAVLGPPPGADQIVEAAGLRLIDTGLALDWTAPDPAALRETAAVLAGLARRLGARSVHLHTPALAAEAPWAMPTVAVAHSCVGTWWQAVRGGPLPEDLAWRVAAVAHGLAEADVVIAPTHAFAEMLARFYRPGRSISVIRNGAPPMERHDGSRETAVFSAGRLWDDAKNATALDRLAATVDVPVVAAGPLSGPSGEQFKPLHLHATGRLAAADVGKLMRGITIFAAPSRYEPFGLAVLEAARAGMALALADIPTFRELWDDAAAFFHPDDDDGLRDAVLRLNENPMPYAARAATRAARYSIDVTVDATLRVHHAVQSTMAS